MGGLTGLPLYAGRDEADTGARQIRRHSEALGWWDAIHDEGALVAWGLWAEGRP